MQSLTQRLRACFAPSVTKSRLYRSQTAFIHESESWSPDRIRTWQGKQLQAVVLHAMTHCAGYRDLYRAERITPKDIQSLNELQYLPCVTKQMIQADLEAFSVPIRGRKRTSTAGSTGVPFSFYVTRDNRAVEHAHMHAGWRRAGWQPGGVTAQLRGGFVGSANQLWAYNPRQKQLSLTSAYLTPDRLPAYLEVIRHYQPTTLHAYPSACLLLADLLSDQGTPVALPFKTILLGSENLYDWQAEKIARAFPDAKLFSWYGHSEKIVLAPWCEYNKTYHCFSTYGLTEIVDEDGYEVGEGEEGEIVGTSFCMWATPFIKYKTGDIGIKGADSCKDCGRYGQIITRIEGRRQEMVISREGRQVSATSLNLHDNTFISIRQFQFMQEIPGHVVFKYVTKNGVLSNEVGNGIYRVLKAKLGEDMIITFMQVDEIPRTKSGKILFLDQKINSQQRMANML